MQNRVQYRIGIDVDQRCFGSKSDHAGQQLILRMAVCELLRKAGTPAPVIINEALELARTFSTEEAVKFINGMLDGVRKKIET